MKKWLAVGIWCAVSLLSILHCQSTQQSPPCHTPRAAKSGPPKQVSECCQGQPCSQQNGTEDHPLVVKLTQSSHAQGEANADETNTPKNPTQPWSLADKIAVGATIAGFLQFLALLFTIGIMVRNGRRQLRAYVMAEIGNIVNVANPDKSKGPIFKTGAELAHPEWGPIVRIQIKNTGQTPAYAVVHWAELYYREFPLKSFLPPMPLEEGLNRSPMGPGIPITKTLFFGPPLTEEQIKGLKNGTAAIYCQGIIWYRDAFLKRHFTRYRLMHGSMGGRIGVNAEFTFCEDGNDTDDTQFPWWKFWR